jgi:hypothetical protein
MTEQAPALNDVVEILLSGGDVSPRNVKAGDIADVIKAVEGMIESVIFKQRQVTLPKETPIVCLTRIDDAASIRLDFTSTVPQHVFPAFQTIATAINTGEFKDLPRASLNALEVLQQFTLKRNCVAKFVRRNGKTDVIAEITASTHIERGQSFKGETVLYGEIIRVGGREPAVMLQTFDGQVIFCKVPKDIALKLGEKLYRAVGLRGIAQWDAGTSSLEDFHVTHITAFEDRPIAEAMKDIAEIARRYYDDVTDADEYVSSIRGEGIET